MERNILSVACHIPQLGTWPTTQARALTRNQTSDILVHSPAHNPLSHTSQSGFSIIKSCNYYNNHYYLLSIQGGWALCWEKFYLTHGVSAIIVPILQIVRLT